MKRKPKRKTKTIKAWGGFSGGELCTKTLKYSLAPVLSIFEIKEKAQAQYEDVRPVTITYEVKP